MSIRENLAGFFADFGEPAEWNGRATRVLFDVPDVLTLDGAMISSDPTATLDPAAWPGIRRGETVTIAGKVYQVTEARLVDDGKLMRIRLET